MLAKTTRFGTFSVSGICQHFHRFHLSTMFQLRCTVRGCQQRLARGESGLDCDAGHHFDRAREGYWNLLQPQDRHSSTPGDSESAVLARHRWLQRGHADGLLEGLRPWIKLPWLTDDSVIARTVDLGCGEGTFGRKLFSDEAESFCGIELSKRAIKLAARQWPLATWVIANADRVLPVEDQSVHRVMSLFGRRPTEEIKRITRPGGTVIIAVPGEDDLIELRQQVQQAGHRRQRWESVVEEMSGDALELIEHQTWRQRITLDAEAIADALAMTYRAGRFSQQARAERLTEMQVTLSADLMLLRRV